MYCFNVNTHDTYRIQLFLLEKNSFSSSFEEYYCIKNQLPIRVGTALIFKVRNLFFRSGVFSLKHIDMYRSFTKTDR